MDSAMLSINAVESKRVSCIPISFIGRIEVTVTSLSLRVGVVEKAGITDAVIMIADIIVAFFISSRMPQG